MEKLLEVVELVALAQQCSDYGKIYRNNGYCSFDKNVRSQEYLDFDINVGKRFPVDYDGKDKAIISAIILIKNSKPFGVNFYVKDNGKNSIVYFDFKIDNEKFQVSFHSFSAEIAAFRGQGRITRWRKGVDSRQTCSILLNLLNPNKEVKIQKYYQQDDFTLKVNLK